MSLQDVMIDKILHSIKPVDVVHAVQPILMGQLDALGAHDEDKDGNPDLQEIKAAFAEMADGAGKFEHGAVKVAGLVQAYKAKYLPKA